MWVVGEKRDKREEKEGRALMGIGGQENICPQKNQDVA